MYYLSVRAFDNLEICLKSRIKYILLLSSIFALAQIFSCHSISASPFATRSPHHNWDFSSTSEKFHLLKFHTLAMHLMYTLDGEGNRVYTLKKRTESGEITKSAHPARFSPDDKYSRQRVTLKKRHHLLPSQQGAY